MIKSKHFRKDVIIARVIFLAVCILLIAGMVWLFSMLTEPKEPQEPTPPESNSSELPSETDSEGETDSETEPESETESESESETESETESENQTEEPVKIYVKVISNRNLNLRKEPNTTSDILASLPNGTKLMVVEELDGWFKVKYEDHVGYVSSQYVKIVEE